MSKARITVTFEYELKPDYYPDDATPDEMVALDVANYRESDSLFDVMQSEELTITGEALQEKQSA